MENPAAKVPIEALLAHGEWARALAGRLVGESEADETDTLAELRRVQSALKRGRYRLTVTVRDLETNATAARSRFVEVRGWERGTTLVPAMPRGR